MIEGREIIVESLETYLKMMQGTFATEYTNLPAFPLIILSYLLGTEFPAYVSSVFYVYYIPACVLLTLFVLRIIKLKKQRELKTVDFIICFLVFALNPAFIWSLVLGYLDVSGIVLIGIMLNYSFDWNGVDFSVKRNLTLAALSITLILTRRWYAYSIVGFYGVYGLITIVKMIIAKKFDFNEIKNLALNMFMIAGVSAILLFVINRDIFIAFFGEDYSSAYSAYRDMKPFR